MTDPGQPVIIANCGGFWGDDPTAARRQVAGGPVDYLVMDYLAEITMAILQKQRAKDPEAGWARDFLVQLGDVLEPCLERGITIISNAGGVNPAACARAVTALAERLGVADRLRIALVSGDSLYEDLDSTLASGQGLEHLETGRPLSDVRDRVLSANVYVGAAPIVEALSMGANVVIAGRVTDTSVTLAPMIHRFGWSPDDWDRLAAGVVAGHIIECGTQCTGGNFTDWHTVASFTDIGYPLIEAHPDGSFVVTKHPGTGGLVSEHTVAEQLLYEMGSPRYLSPDCVARFDTIRLAQEGPDRVRVSGIRGEAPPERLKVAVSYADGYRAVGRMLVSGPDTLRKARKAAEIFWEAAGGVAAYDSASTQFVGWDAAHPPLAAEEPGEVLMQVAVRDRDRHKIEVGFTPTVVGRMLGSIPGFTMPSDQGRPRPSEVVGHWPALIDRASVITTVTMGDETRVVPTAIPGRTGPGAPAEATAPVEAGDRIGEIAPGPAATGAGETVSVPLGRLCLARSGDKGDTANVGVIARSDEVYAWLVRYLTPDVVAQHFKDACQGPVERFELPNLRAVNFLLHESLGGGGTLSLRFDAQGKTYAQYLLALPVEVPAAVLDSLG